MEPWRRTALPLPGAGPESKPGSQDKVTSILVHTIMYVHLHLCRVDQSVHTQNISMRPKNKLKRLNVFLS